MTTLYTPEEFVSELAKYGIKQVLPVETIIYKYAPFETALKIIENNSLLFSPPTSFNDPFDLTNALIDKSFTETDLRTWLDSFPNLDSAKKEMVFESNWKDKNQLMDILDGILNKFKAIAGISCFSKSFKKTLMWSHYADKHAGICLGFNIVPIGIPKFSLLEVNYVDKIVPLNYFSKKHVTLLYWLYTKSKVWEYEEEVRAVHQEVNGLINFHPHSLREIYYGLRTTKEQKDKLNGLLSDLKYRVEKVAVMEINPNTFDLKETTC